MARIDYRAVAADAARRAGIDPDTFVRQIGAESNFNPRALSPAGAIGIAQIMPATARGWKVNPRDPNAALRAAATNMARYLKSYGGDWRKALAAYNAGPGAVQKYGGVPPYAETQNYIKKILQGQTPSYNPGGGGDPDPFSGAAAPEARPQDNAALLLAMQNRGEGQSLTRTLGRAILAQRQSGQMAASDPMNASDSSGGTDPSTHSPYGTHNDIMDTAEYYTPVIRGGKGYSWAEELGKKFGLRLSSTYRSPARNASVGGSRTSAHMSHGAATDFAGTPAQMRRLAEWAIKSGLYREVFYDPVGQWDNGKFSRRGIGGHGDHVHITR